MGLQSKAGDGWRTHRLGWDAQQQRESKRCLLVDTAGMQVPERGTVNRRKVESVWRNNAVRGVLADGEKIEEADCRSWGQRLHSGESQACGGHWAPVRLWKIAALFHLRFGPVPNLDAQNSSPAGRMVEAI